MTEILEKKLLVKEVSNITLDLQSFFEKKKEEKDTPIIRNVSCA